MKTRFLFLAILLSTSAHAAPAMMEANAEQRKQMADMHKRAADCLNSAKPMQECRDEMMKNSSHMAKGMGEKWGCPMMGDMTQPDSKTKTTK